MIFGAISSFVNFPQTTRTEFDLPQYSVRRRYQDFDWLRIKLEDSQPTHLIPVGGLAQAATVVLVSSHLSHLPSSPRLQPLPEKFVMKGVVDRFSEDFVGTRMKALDKFLKRVADHPVLSFNPHLSAFLTAKVGWKRARRVWDLSGGLGL